MNTKHLLRISLIMLLLTFICACGANEVSSNESILDTRLDDAKAIYIEAVENYNECISDYNEGAKIYNQKVEQFNAANDTLVDYLTDVEESGVQDEQPYDPEVMEKFKAAVVNARLSIKEAMETVELKNAAEAEVFESTTSDNSSLDTSLAIINTATSDIAAKTEAIVTSTDAVIANTELIDVPDFTGTIEELEPLYQAACDTVAVQKQITKPSEEFVISRLYTVDGIESIEAVTPSNDPNGKLGIAHGYTAAVYFELSDVPNDWVWGDTPVQMGTDGGGCIEVYENVEDAESRNTYLSAFDTGALRSGSHIVLGTMVLRVSTQLSADKQILYTDSIISAFTRLE